MRTAIYARVSTKPQELNLQTEELTAYIHARGWELALPPFEEKISSAADHRQKFEEMMIAARQRRFDVLLVWRYDRFARSVIELLTALEEFRNLGVDFISLKDGVDTSSPTGKLMFTVLAGIAEFNRNLIRQNVSAGLAAAKEKLKSGPYTRIRDGKLITVTAIGRPRVAVDSARVAELRLQGYTWQQISHGLGIGQGTARRAFNLAAKSLSKGEVLTP